MTNPAIKEALNYEMMFSQDEIKRREYELQEKAIRDYNSTMLYNRNEGIKIGEQSKANKIALRMLKRGYDINEIAEDTELSIDEVKNLQKTLL